jgi:preprotein translocase SecE subunit
MQMVGITDRCRESRRWKPMVATKKTGKTSVQMAKSEDGANKDVVKNPAPAQKAKSTPAKAAAKTGSAEVKERKERKKDEKGGIGKSIAEARQFLREVYIEFNKITWPERSRVIRETYSVLVLVALITVMVLAFDWFLGNAIFGPIEHWARLHGGGIGKG